MLSLIFKLLPFLVVGLASPALISFCIVLLSSRKPLQTTLSFVLGAAAILLTLGAIVLVAFDGKLIFRSPDIGQTISLILGGVFILLAIKYYLNVPDPDAPPPHWLEKIDTITPLQAFLLGLLLIGTNLKVLGAFIFGLNQIVQARVSLGVGLVLVVLVLLCVLSGLLAPIVVYVHNPAEANQVLGRLKEKVIDASRVLLAAILLVLGIYFVIEGLFGS